MLDNTGTVSLILYGIFIAITIIALIVVFRIILKGSVDASKLDKMIELFKYAIVSTAIATLTLIVTDLFKEREQDVKELEYFDKYVNDVKKVNGIEERFALVKYFSIVAPKGPLKNSWMAYYVVTENEYKEYKKLKEQEIALAAVKNLSPEQIVNKMEISKSINRLESPLVAYKVAATNDFQSARDWETKGFDLLLKKNVKEAILAFVESENVANGYHRSYEIAQYLKTNYKTLTGDDPGAWKNLNLQLATTFSDGMPSGYQNKFLELSK